MCDNISMFGAQYKCKDCGAVWDRNDSPPDVCNARGTVKPEDAAEAFCNTLGAIGARAEREAVESVSEWYLKGGAIVDATKAAVFTRKGWELSDGGVPDGPTRQPCGIRLDLIPGDVLAEIGKVFAAGAKKYGDHNWSSGRLKGDKDPINHALKHIVYYNAGVADDEDEDGTDLEIHLRHAITNLMFELYYQLHQDEYGDRHDGKHKRVR